MHLPLSWDDPATQLAIRKYMQSVRPDAPWCPSNIEFIRRINGLDRIEDGARASSSTRSYLVLGLGDVYLGAPVATPVDPRHRLVTTKYNPARTWTPENAVGIGGAYLCVYGMEGPGGYQFVGRTVQMWNRFRADRATSPPARRGCCASSTRSASIPVSAAELLAFARGVPARRARGAHRGDVFRLARLPAASSATTPTSIAAFKARQQAAFAAERERWAALAAASSSERRRGARRRSDGELPAGARRRARRTSPAASGRSLVEPGDRVAAPATRWSCSSR